MARLGRSHRVIGGVDHSIAICPAGVVAPSGVEAGAALWFGGAVALSVRRTTTVRRGLVVVMTGAIGAALIVLALSFGWSGAVLALAMEFGVGALAIVVIDVIVLGAIQPGLESLARQADTASVDLEFGWHWPPVAMRVHRTPLLTDRVDEGRR